jgi:hypothetical protein
MFNEMYLRRYANLTDLSFLSTDGFIAGVTNPMFKTKKEWWDICCDIASGEVFVSQQEKEKEEYENLDRHFILEVKQTYPMLSI